MMARPPDKAIGAGPGSLLVCGTLCHTSMVLQTLRNPTLSGFLYFQAPIDFILNEAPNLGPFRSSGLVIQEKVDI